MLWPLALMKRWPPSDHRCAWVQAFTCMGIIEMLVHAVKGSCVKQESKGRRGGTFVQMCKFARVDLCVHV